MSLNNSLEFNFSKVINMIETRRNNAYKKVNEELISYIGIFENKIVDKLVKFMKREYLTMRGFNKCGIYRMKQFYETYKDFPFVSPLVTQISWTNNLLILSGYFHRYMLSDGKANQSLSKTVEDMIHKYLNDSDAYVLKRKMS